MRERDLVVFGATGFAGRVAVRYFARHLPRDISWVVAGRSREKLDELLGSVRGLPSPPNGALVVDQGDGPAVEKVVGQARIVASYAGPFNRFGESVVAACAGLGTHYIDITGETLWVRRMMDRHQAAAERSGAVLIPFSGFDSVPSDLGAWKVCAAARAKDPGAQVTRVVSLIETRGGLNGGTFATLLDLLALGSEDRAMLHDPTLLVPEPLREKYRFPELARAIHVPEARLTAPPFFMASINSRTVYRSQALRGDTPFEYQELLSIPRIGSALRARAMIAGLAVFERAGRLSAVRRLLSNFGVKPGQGPSEEVQSSGFIRSRFFAYAGTKPLAQLELYCPGDPGNQATALLSCESVLCLLKPSAGFAMPHGGFWTPSTALGAALCERLERAGVRFRPKRGSGQ